jgi:hypothetical protein
MFLALHHDVVILGRDLARLLDCLPAIFDWTRLGVFTGSRLGEYGQSKPRAGELFAAVPISPDASIWANTPLAFIRDAFTFYDALRHLLDRTDLELLSHCAIEVHVCFRFDKSTLNFSIRKFHRTPWNFMCAVKSSISILHHAHHLGGPAEYQVGVYHSMTEGDYSFIHGDDVSSIMCYACPLLTFSGLSLLVLPALAKKVIICLASSRPPAAARLRIFLPLPGPGARTSLHIRGPSSSQSPVLLLGCAFFLSSRLNLFAHFAGLLPWFTCRSAPMRLGMAPPLLVPRVLLLLFSFGSASWGQTVAHFSPHVLCVAALWVAAQIPECIRVQRECYA